MKRTSNGFTLVELIVVVAIIGILAAILVPSLMGYVSDSKLEAANNNARGIYTAVSRLSTKAQAVGNNVGTGRIWKQDSSGSGAYGSGINYNAMNIRDIDKEINSASDWVYYVEMKDDLPVSVLAAKTKNDFYVGSYPAPADEKSSKSLSEAGSLGVLDKTQNANTILGE